MRDPVQVPHPEQDKPMIIFGMLVKLALLVYLLSFYDTQSLMTLTQGPQERIAECLATSGAVVDGRPDKNTLSVATFNAEWLFYEPDSTLQCGDPKIQCPWDTAEDSLKHISKIAEVVKELNADAVSFTEVQDCHVLQVLLNDHNLKGDSYKPYLILGADEKLKQNVGVISRITPTATFRTSLSRKVGKSQSKCGEWDEGIAKASLAKNILARFEVPGIPPFTIIGVHLKAIPKDPNKCVNREAQAKVIKEIVKQEILDGQEVILVGDFNDYDDEVPDINNNVPNSMVFKTLRSTGLFGKQELWNLLGHSSIPQTERYSHWWDKNKDCMRTNDELSLLDHILVTEKLKDKVQSVEIFNKIPNTCGSMHSDHYPIKVTFNTQHKEEEPTKNEQTEL